MFGGNSNWRGPVWFPVNVLIIRGLLQFYLYYGDGFTIECPTGSGKTMNLFEVAREIVARLTRIFLRDDRGRRPVYGGTEKFQSDPHWRDYFLFYEYFHGDNGAGLGASHQTGWTGTVAQLIWLFGVLDPRPVIGHYSKDGKLHSMPFNVSTPILYYNKDVFKKAGLGDTPPATWPDVEAASRKILAAGAAKCGFTTPSPSWTMLENTFAWHDQPFATNQNGYAGLDTKLLINSDFGLMHVGALVRWQKENIFSYGGREGQRNSKFIDGDCAMVIQSSASIGGFKKCLTFDWGTGQLPHWGPPYPKANTILGGATLWALRGPADDKGVAQFLKFITDPPQQRWWAATTGYVPITKTAVKSLEDDSFYKQNPEQWTAVSQLLNAKPTPNSQGLRLGNYVEVREATVELELENIFTGRKTVKQGLDHAVGRGNAILRQFGVTHGAAASGEI